MKSSLETILGEGVTQTENLVIIPRQNLQYVGLDGQDYASILCAVILRVSRWFDGFVRVGNDFLIDHKGTKIAYDYNDLEESLNSRFTSTYYSDNLRVWEFTLEWFGSNFDLTFPLELSLSDLISWDSLNFYLHKDNLLVEGDSLEDLLLALTLAVRSMKLPGIEIILLQNQQTYRNGIEDHLVFLYRFFTHDSQN